MKNLLRRFVSLFLVLFMFSVSVVPVFAANDYADNGVTVNNSGGNITIGPGKYPSLGGSMEDATKEMTKGLNQYKNIGMFILGMSTITMALLLIIQFVFLGHAGDDPAARKKAIHKILICGIATALLGSLDLVISIFSFNNTLLK